MKRAIHRYREAYQAAAVGLLANLSLGVSKLVAGLISQSSALIADAVNSLGDSLASIAVLYGLKVAQQPADEEHPYGHTKAEGIAATSVAVAIIISAAIVGWEALWRIGGTVPQISWWALAIPAGNVLLKEALFHYNMRVGKRTGSSSVMANAWDHRADALSSLAVLISLSIIYLGGSRWSWVDPITAILVSLGVIWAGIQLFRQSASDLMDVQADPEFVAEIRQSALSVEGVEEIETLLVRKTGLEFFVDIHIEVDANLTVDQGHRISHRVKAFLLDQFQELRDVLVHIEPFPHCHDH